MKPTIGVIIQTYNESGHIEQCIESARKLSSTILVIDTESTDDTVLKAKKMGVEVKSFPFSRYVEPARTFGIEQMDADWVFILDADERITDALSKEILKTIETTTDTYFRVPRTNMFAAKIVLKHGGWFPDSQMRLIQKKSFVQWPARIHATPEIKGSCGILQNAIEHHFHGDLETMVSKTIVFEDVESELLFKANKPVSVKTFFRKFLGELSRRLIKKKGYLDGTIGIIECIYQAYSKTITYLYLYEKKKSTTH